MMYGYDTTTAGWLWMVGGWVVLVAAIVGGAWLISRSLQAGRGSGRTAMEILQERFARGELSPDEFEKAKQALG